MLFLTQKNALFKPRLLTENLLKKCLLIAGLILAATALPYRIDAATFTVTTGADSGAGSFRQAITDANSTLGADLIQFSIPQTDPTYDATKGWFLIEPGTSYPLITETVTIDATTQASSIADSNPGMIGSGGTVGTDALALPQIARQEILFAPPVGVYIDHLIRISGSSANGSVVRGIAAYGFGPNPSQANSSYGTIWIDDSQNVTVEHNLIGTDPDTLDAPSRANNTHHVSARANSSGLTIRNNIFNFNSIGGVFIINETATDITGLTLSENEFVGMGNAIASNALELQINQESAQILLERNRFSGNNAREQIDLVGLATGVVIPTMQNNSILDSDPATPRTAGVRLRNVQGSLIENNIITGNDGPAILVSSFNAGPSPLGSYDNRITQNRFGQNDGLAIELCKDCASSSQGDGVDSPDSVYDTGRGNNGIDHPTVVEAILINEEQMYVEGGAFANSTVEIYAGLADADGFDISSGVGYGEGLTYLGSITTDGLGTFSGIITITDPDAIDGNHITGIAIDSDGNTSEFGPNFTTMSSTAVGIIKSASSTTFINPDSYNVTFTLTVSNYGSYIVTLEEIIDNLQATFPTGVTYSIISLSSTTPGVSLNQSYNGNSNTNLLASNFDLDPAEQLSIQLTVQFDPNGIAGPYYNTATISANSSGFALTDSSHTSDYTLDAPTPITFQAELTDTGDSILSYLIIFAIGGCVLTPIVIYWHRTKPNRHKPILISIALTVISVLILATQLSFRSQATDLESLLDPTLEELSPGTDWPNFFQTNTGITPNATYFGAYVFREDGTDLYMGLGAGRPADIDGAAIAKFDGSTLSYIGDLDEQGVHDMDINSTTHTLYIAGSDPAFGDDWQLGNFYTYNTNDGLQKYRTGAGLTNVIHTWGLTQDPDGNLYAATSIQDDCPGTCINVGAVYKSTNGGANWSKLTNLGGYRNYDMIYWEGKFYAIATEVYQEPLKLYVSDDATNWSLVPGLDDLSQCRIMIFDGKLLLMDYDRDQFYAVSSDQTFTTHTFTPGLVGLFYGDATHFANYNQFTIDGAGRFYAVTEDGTIYRTTDLNSWESVISTGKQIITLYYWQNQNTLLIAEKGLAANVWKLQLEELEQDTEPEPDPTDENEPNETGTITIPPQIVPPIETPFCGDGQIDPGEECDPALPATELCESRVPGSTGLIYCTEKCTLDIDACPTPSEPEIDEEEPKDDSTDQKDNQKPDEVVTEEGIDRKTKVYIAGGSALLIFGAGVAIMVRGFLPLQRFSNQNKSS